MTAATFLLLSLLLPYSAVSFLFVPSSSQQQRPRRPCYRSTSPWKNDNDAWSNNHKSERRRSYYGGRRALLVARNSNRWDQEIEESSRRRQQQQGGGSGIGETAAGAVLGGLLLGPFGAMFGASIGSNIGAKNAMSKARKEEMERLGITQDMLDSARDIGMALEKSNEGIKASQDSLETQQRFARRLENDANEIYECAKRALSEGDEDLARKLLLERQNGLDKLKQVLQNCAEERKRLEVMQNNVAALETRATEIDSLLRRTVGAKAFIDSTSTSQENDIGLSLSKSDPLLQKFKDLGID